MFIDEVPTSKKGRRAVCINTQLGTFMGKTGSSMRDVRLLFASIDCKPPSEHLLQLEANKTTKVWEEVNETAMKENCEIVSAMTDESEKVRVATDTAYNNPSKGMGGGRYQPGTQSYSPMVHAETGLVLSATTYNKMCANNCIGQCGPDCTTNWPLNRAMGGSEVTAVVSNLEKIKESGIQPGAMVCDGTAKTLTSKYRLKSIDIM